MAEGVFDQTAGGRLNAKVVWTRDEANPVVPPIAAPAMGGLESTRCMNPFILRVGDEYRLYYSGGDAGHVQRLCLATASVKSPTQWQRQGVVLDVGPAGGFDAKWVVLPHVLRVGSKWHLYYTSNSGVGEGLAQFPGIGLAVSDDGRHFERLGTEPVIAASGRDGDADAIGIAGGSVIEVRLPTGDTEWRFYYTGCPTVGKELHLNQQKIICYATSTDAIHWEKRGPLMGRDPNRDYEDVATAGPVVHQLADGSFRMWYSAIGTRWGYYSICYAESDDGLTWRRGEAWGDNLQLTPDGKGVGQQGTLGQWETQMVAYPAVIEEGDGLRLFYCGNGYGSTGIGTARGKIVPAAPVVGA